MIEESVRQALLADEAVAAIAVDRVYAGHKPQGIGNPATTIRLARRDPISDLGGETGIVESLIQVDCWADDYAAAKSLAAAVVDCLADFSGTLGDSDTTNAEDCRRAAEADSLLAPVDASDTPLHWIPLQFLFVHDE